MPDVDGMTLPCSAKGRATVTASVLRVREQPDINAFILGWIKLDQVVTVWAVDATWAIVQDANGLTGWASMAYLQPLGELVA